MKPIFKIITLAFVMLMGMAVSPSLYAQEDATGDEGNVSSYLTPDNPDPARGERMPAAPLLCTISKTNGVQIAGVDTSEIESFEIRDVYGNTVAVLSDEASFVETLFSLKGEYRVIFQLSDRSLAGWINM